MKKIQILLISVVAVIIILFAYDHRKITKTVTVINYTKLETSKGVYQYTIFTNEEPGKFTMNIKNYMTALEKENDDIIGKKEIIYYKDYFSKKYIITFFQ